jgi:hypothetical protein
MKLEWLRPLLGHWITETGKIDNEFYLALVTMHGTVMVFFVLTAGLSGTFSNFLIPLQVGARDMASGFINMLSYWFFFLNPTELVNKAVFGSFGSYKDWARDADNSTSSNIGSFGSELNTDGILPESLIGSSGSLGSNGGGGSIGGGSSVSNDDTTSGADSSSGTNSGTNSGSGTGSGTNSGIRNNEGGG